MRRDMPSTSHVPLALAALLLCAAVGVRALAPAPVVEPQDAPIGERRIDAPMQLLGANAELRVGEVDALVSEPLRTRFSAERRLVFGLRGCPELHLWLDGADGQRIARFLGELRAGSREDAFAALVLVMRIARATEWKPGMLGADPNAERLGTLLEDWLRAWGERGAKDPLLAEPALAATLVYGRAMRVAWDAPVVGTNKGPYLRACSFLVELLGLERGANSGLGERVQARHPHATMRLRGEDDRLRGLDEEALALFPDLRGDCSR